MGRPYFTVAIPTKNRPDRLGDAVKSVADQTFKDVEIIVCDNSDEAQAVETRTVVDAFSDARVRYLRTNGRLSMPDNWERSIADARGEYVGILTDRSVFHRRTLQVVHDEIEKTGAKLVSWFPDHYGRERRGSEFRQRECTFRRHHLESRSILDYFTNGNPKFAPKIIPRLMTSVCHRSILDAIRATPVGRCCPPVCPDYTSGFLMLAHCDRALILHEALFVSCGFGNGFEFRMRGELADRFMRDLGMTWPELVDHMPSQACFTQGLILNDLMRLRGKLPHLFRGIEVNHVQYYLGCMIDYAKASRRGVERKEDMQLLLAALEQEPELVRREVKAHRVFAKAIQPRPRRVRDSAASGRDDGPDEGNALRFDTVFGALAWDEANPRTPASSSFLDLLPGIQSRDWDSKMGRQIGYFLALPKRLGRAWYGARLPQSAGRR